MTVMDFQLGYSPADLTSPLIEYLDQVCFVSCLFALGTACGGCGPVSLLVFLFRCWWLWSCFVAWCSCFAFFERDVDFSCLPTYGGTAWLVSRVSVVVVVVVVVFVGVLCLFLCASLLCASPPDAPLTRARFLTLFSQEGFEMDTLVDAGLAPDTSKWKYPTSSSVRMAIGTVRVACLFFTPARMGEGGGAASYVKSRESEA